MGNIICGVGVVDNLPLPLPFLPEEVLIEILLWLPVKSLLRFKSVCKSWRDLIQTPFFIHLHTTTTFNSSSSNSKQIGGGGGGGDTFILQTSRICGGGGGGGGGGYWLMDRNMFMLSFESGSSGSGGDDDQVVFKLDNLGFPPYPYNKVFLSTHRIHMVSSCNGLICLYDTKLRDVSLWNPATRQFRILPKSITIQEEEEEDEDEDGIGKFWYDRVALGFDVKTKDYKVVQISCFGPSICRVQVYSLSTDSWRLLEGINYLPTESIHGLGQNQLGLYLNGRYFFMGRKCSPKLRNDSLMVSFDFTKEIFTTMQFPDHDDRCNLLITHLGDKIALFTTRMKSLSSFRPRGDDDDYEYYDIWVLNEQGGDVNKESWAKLHSFRIKGRVGRELILPRGILNNGKFALIETESFFSDDSLNELHLLNLVTKEPKSFRIWNKMSKAAVYKHSLVSIIGEKGASSSSQ